jgi:hypothetical protein
MDRREGAANDNRRGALMARTLSEIAAACRKEPYPFPMPDGEVIMIAQPSLKTDTAAVAAAISAGSYGGGLLAGLRVYAGQEDGDKIADAWEALPVAALSEAATDMRDYFAAPVKP